MKKIFSSFLALLLVISFLSQSIAATNDVSVIINGQSQTYDQPPVLENGRVLVPMRAVFESLGANIQWEQSTKTVTGTKGDIKVTLKLGSKIANVNGSNVTLDVPANTINNRTMVPLRFVSESLGAKVYWDSASYTVTINKKQDTENEQPQPVQEEKETVVNGIITNDTVWTIENSPYSIEEKIQVSSGTTLTIGAGVVVKNANIEVFGNGKLKIIGKETNKIILNDLSIRAEDRSNTSVEIIFAEIKGGNGYFYNSWISGEFILKNSIIDSRDIRLLQPTLNSTIEENLFINSTIYMTSTSANTTIKNNTFTSNSVSKKEYIVFDYADVNSQQINIEGNNFINNDKVVIRVKDTASSDYINVKNNYWGTKDKTKITQMIYDGNDDLNNKAIIDYEPILQQVNPTAPSID